MPGVGKESGRWRVFRLPDEGIGITLPLFHNICQYMSSKIR
jgi:hypothetical protein